MYQEALNGFCGIRINPRFDDNVTLCPWLASLYLSDSMSFCRDDLFIYTTIRFYVLLFIMFYYYFFSKKY